MEKLTNLYQYSELSEKAKQKARDWYTGEGFEFQYDFVFDDFTQICDILGIDLYPDLHHSNQSCRAIIECVRDLAKWLYRTLEVNYDFQRSDDNVAENIKANEYEFLESGAQA